MTWYICRDITGRPAVARHQLSDDLVHTTEDHEEAMRLVHEMLSAHRANAPGFRAPSREPA